MRKGTRGSVDFGMAEVERGRGKPWGGGGVEEEQNQYLQTDGHFWTSQPGADPSEPRFCQFRGHAGPPGTKRSGFRPAGATETRIPRAVRRHFRVIGRPEVGFLGFRVSEPKLADLAPDPPRRG